MCLAEEGAGCDYCGYQYEADGFSPCPECGEVNLQDGRES